MAVQTIHRKKRIELHYLEEARSASLIFPQGAVIPHERPDFLLPNARGTIGIEMTELCREEPRAENGRLRKVPERARARYSRHLGAKPVDVSPAFSRRADHLSVDQLADTLADFAYANRHSNAGFTRNLPEGYCHIGVFDPLEPASQGRWRYFRAFDTVLAPKELIESRIAEKNRRVCAYRAAAPEAWLLIVNDQFLGPGEVYARPEDLMRWTFAFDFDKVLLVSREPGGRVDVIQLLRN